MQLPTMFTGKKHLPLIVYVELKRITLYSALSPEPLILDFPEDAVEDMEMADTRFLETQLANWNTDEKIVHSNTFIIFSEDCYFRQDFPKVPAAEDPQLKQFFSMVPFEHRLDKVFQTQNGGVAVSMGKNMYRPVVQVFDAHQYRVVLALPQFAINTELFKQAKPGEVALKLSSMFDQLKLLSFVSEEERQKKIKADQKIQTGLPQDKKQLIILSGVFGVLIIALILVYRWSITPDPLPPQPEPPVVVPIKPVEDTIPSTEASAAADLNATPSPEEVRATTIQVLNGSGIPGQADQVKQALEAVGFLTITTGNNTGGKVSRASIVFSSDVSAGIQQLVLTAVSSVVSADPIVAVEANVLPLVKIITSP